MLEIEDFIPKENFYVGLLFDEGYWLIKMLRRQQLTVKMPYAFGDVGAGQVSSWVTPTDPQGRFYLEPQEEETVYQFFIGLSPSQAKMYLQYTEREDRMNLIAPRPTPGQIGFWDGEMTTYHDPSPLTELWAVHDIVPYFRVQNPYISGVFCNSMQFIYINASFWISAYTYEVIQIKPETADQDKRKILQFLRGERRCTVRTMGDGNRPIKAPAWLLARYKESMIQPEEV